MNRPKRAATGKRRKNWFDIIVSLYVRRLIHRMKAKEGNILDYNILKKELKRFMDEYPDEYKRGSEISHLTREEYMNDIELTSIDEETVTAIVQILESDDVDFGNTYKERRQYVYGYYPYDSWVEEYWEVENQLYNSDEIFDFEDEMLVRSTSNESNDGTYVPKKAKISENAAAPIELIKRLQREFYLKAPNRVKNIAKLLISSGLSSSDTDLYVATGFEMIVETLFSKDSSFVHFKTDKGGTSEKINMTKRVHVISVPAHAMVVFIGKNNQPILYDANGSGKIKNINYLKKLKNPDLFGPNLILEKEFNPHRFELLGDKFQCLASNIFTPKCGRCASWAIFVSLVLGKVKADYSNYNEIRNFIIGIRNDEARIVSQLVMGLLVRLLRNGEATRDDHIPKFTGQRLAYMPNEPVGLELNQECWLQQITMWRVKMRELMDKKNYFGDLPVWTRGVDPCFLNKSWNKMRGIKSKGGTSVHKSSSSLSRIDIIRTALQKHNGIIRVNRAPSHQLFTTFHFKFGYEYILNPFNNGVTMIVHVPTNTLKKSFLKGGNPVASWGDAFASIKKICQNNADLRNVLNFDMGRIFQFSHGGILYARNSTIVTRQETLDSVTTTFQYQLLWHQYSDMDTPVFLIDEFRPGGDVPIVCTFKRYVASEEVVINVTTLLQKLKL